MYGLCSSELLRRCCASLPPRSNDSSLTRRTREDGLTDAEVTERLGIFGHNKLEAKETSAILQFL